jgi:hypothetical protein
MASRSALAGSCTSGSRMLIRRDRLQIGGFDVSPDELSLFLAGVQAMTAYARGVCPSEVAA